ncbi:unnamed protein product [Closterium sp. NIES-53]
MAKHIDVTTLTQDCLNKLLQQLRESSEEIAALTAERTSLQNDVARAQQAHSQAPGTPGQPAPHHHSTEVWGNPRARPSLMPLKPQRPPCFDPSQRGGPTVQVWLFTFNVFFDTNCVLEDTANIRYAVSLLRGPAMDWWRVIVTKPTDYATLPTREGQTGPWAPSYFVEVPQYCTCDVWCAGLRARFEPIAASIAAREKLRTWLS